MKSIAIAVLVAFVGACGTTQIVANDSRARIFVDGELVGKGQAEITKRGFPGSAHVVVKAPDGRESRRTLSRNFTLTTFFLGIMTYYTCMIACWEYPDSVFVLLDEPTARSGDVATSDPWTTPPHGWAETK